MTICKLQAIVSLLLTTDKDGEALAALAGLKRVLAAAHVHPHDFSMNLANGLNVPTRKSVTSTWNRTRPSSPMPKTTPSRKPRPEPPPKPELWQEQIKFCYQHKDKLQQKELAFVCSLVLYPHTPSLKQLDWLTDIYARLYMRTQRTV